MCWCWCSLFRCCSQSKREIIKKFEHTTHLIPDNNLKETPPSEHSPLNTGRSKEYYDGSPITDPEKLPYFTTRIEDPLGRDIGQTGQPPISDAGPTYSHHYDSKGNRISTEESLRRHGLKPMKF